MNILITGGSRGIGKATSEALAKDGHNILIVGKSLENLEHIESSLQGSEGIIKTLQVDLSHRQEISELFKRSKDLSFPPLNTIIINAGIYEEGTVMDSPVEALEEIMQVNVYSAWQLIQLFFGDLEKSPSAKIIFIGSSAALRGHPSHIYSVSKWALRGLAANLRESLMEKGIGVSIIHPGAVKTDMWDPGEKPDEEMIQPEDIALLIKDMLHMSPQCVVEEVIMRPQYRRV